MDTTQIKDWHAHVYFDPASRDSAWWLRPWMWMLAALVSAGVAYLWARATSANEVPLDLLQVPLVAFGVLLSYLVPYLYFKH